MGAEREWVFELIDVHAHLADPSFTNIKQIVARAREKGVQRIVVSITRPAESLRALELVGSFPDFISLTVGFDPSIIDQQEYQAFLNIVVERSSTLVGIGEVGLDHYRVTDHHERAVQESLFRTSIRLAKSLGLPLVVHSRSAGKRALEVLHSEDAGRVLMHAFDGKAGDALAAAKHGYYFSIPTSIVYSEQKQKLARLLPLGSLMLETDSPVLAPVRGERNEPANLVRAAEKIAELKRITVGEVASATTENAKRLFWPEQV
jgi:TatD DNase family protein